MFIQTEATPNPATLKFMPGQAVMGAQPPADFPNAEAAKASPLASALFALEHVTGVFFGADFITVTKDDAEWQHIKPAILTTIMDHFVAGLPVMHMRKMSKLPRKKTKPGLMRKLSARSSNCSTRACAPPLRKMAAILFFTAIGTAWYRCICAVPVRAAPARRPRSSTVLKICSDITSPRSPRCGR